jgi:hypothetical protein
VDLRKIISIDSKVLNYSTFFPGKMLGSTLSVSNLTNFEQIVELSVDALTLKFSKPAIMEKFENPDLPFKFEADGKKVDYFVNSEVKYESWYIENPVSRELTKRITLKLGPKAE